MTMLRKPSSIIIPPVNSGTPSPAVVANNTTAATAGGLDLKQLEDIFERLGSDAASLSRGSEEKERMSLKERIKLIAPHVGLVLACAVYAAGGGAAFYAIEQPTEVDMKRNAVLEIESNRSNMIDSLWNSRRDSEDDFARYADDLMNQLTNRLYKGYSEEYVTFDNVRQQNNATSDHWTMSTAIFFAATTMSTVGYGNVVPKTTLGQMVCIGFALLGTPLAIVTIGDVGKFFSEYTVSFYRKYCRLRDRVLEYISTVLRPVYSRMPYGDYLVAKLSTAKRKDSLEDDEYFDDEITDKTQVPVIIVFAVLLFYTALGAFLFSALEGWSYVDSFYFCFVSLTTIGFGDIVPHQEQYYPLLIIYIAIGLAVATMCIDLVGIHYVEKLHNIGKKLPQNIDLRALLKRRRMIERRLAMVQEAQAAAGLMSRQSSIHDPPPIPSVPSWTQFSEDRSPTTVTTATSIRERMRMYGEIPETPSWRESLDFEVDFVPPSPNFSELAQSAKARKRTSLEPQFRLCPRTPTPPCGLAGMEFWDSYQYMRHLSEQPCPFLPEIAISPTSDDDSSPKEPPDLLRDLEDQDLDYLSSASSNNNLSPAESVIEFPASRIVHKDNPVYSVQEQAIDSERALVNSVNCPVDVLCKKPPTMVSENYCFVVDGDAVELDSILEDDSWWKPTGKPTRYYYSEDGTTFQRVNVITAKDNAVVSARLTKTNMDVGLDKVYKVARYYSYWKSCTDFHRIVSVVCPVDRVISEGNNRIFVQYLWRTDNPDDKARVLMEFDPYGRRKARFSTASGVLRRESRTFSQSSQGSQGPTEPTTSTGGSKLDKIASFRRKTLHFL